MEQQITNLLANYGVLGIIAVVFFRGYFDDKKKSYEFNEKVLAFQKEMAVILNKSNETLEGNHLIIKDTRIIHDDMNERIDEIFKKMATCDNQVEIIKALNDLRKAWDDFSN